MFHLSDESYAAGQFFTTYRCQVESTRCDIARVNMQVILPYCSVGFAELEILVDLLVFVPSLASCSKKSDHSSAKDSFLLPLSRPNSEEDRAGVLGVRCHGDFGTARLGLEAPGLASPACSLSSESRFVRSEFEERRTRELAYHQTNPTARQQSAEFGISSHLPGQGPRSGENGWLSIVCRVRQHRTLLLRARRLLVNTVFRLAFLQIS